MKIRTGFISNSSSSSFMMVIPGDVWDDLIEKVTPYEKHIVSQLFGNAKFDGKPVKFYNGEIGTDCESWIMECTEHETEPGNMDRWDIYAMREQAFYNFCDRAEKEYDGRVLADCSC